MAALGVRPRKHSSFRLSLGRQAILGRRSREKTGSLQWKGREIFNPRRPARRTGSAHEETPAEWRTLPASKAHPVVGVTLPPISFWAAVWRPAPSRPLSG
jgi:hypothetical protein